MKTDLWIIEARRPDGTLDFTEPQPESVFGMAAIHGIDDWAMSRVVYARNAEVTLRGDDIANWPSVLDPRWKARPKTW